MPTKPQILKVNTVAQSQLFKVEAVDLEFSNGVKRTYERLANRGRGAVMIVAINKKDELILIREYAVGIEDYVLTLPKGLIDPGENALQAADRELKEEAGFGAHQLSVLREMSSAPNYMGHKLTAILANDLYPCSLEGDEPEPMEIVFWPLSKLDQLIDSSDVHEGRVIAALCLLQRLKAKQIG